MVAIPKTCFDIRRLTEVDNAVTLDLSLIMLTVLQSEQVIKKRSCNKLRVVSDQVSLWTDYEKKLVCLVLQFQAHTCQKPFM